MHANPTPPAASPDDFRAHLPNQLTSGERKWLYPRATTGRYTRWRMVVAGVLLALLIAGPFVWVDGHPLFLFNILERRFILFGVPFWPQDFYLVAIGLITSVVFIAVFTVIYGRVFCGWACPQTIFMEGVFRTVERWIEGDHKARQQRDTGPWTTDKLIRKTAKHLVFFLMAFGISNVFLAYVIGRDAWQQLISDPPDQHALGLLAMLVFTGVFYAVFAHLREIVCTTICPYGRLQSVLLDRHSLVVAYDFVRGEPRGKRRRTAPAPAPQTGDCVDCALCVQVCPTGIDIRNGTQLECINCTACMDACDQVMTTIGRPRGLIRLDSQQGIETGQGFRITARLGAYTALLLVLLGVMTYGLLSRPDLDVTILRAPGQLYQRTPAGQIQNLYTADIINKTYHTLPLTLRVDRPGATLRLVQPLTQVLPGTLTKALFFITLPDTTIRQPTTPLTIDVLSDGRLVDQFNTTFTGPATGVH